MSNYSYDTVTEALVGLKERGYTTDFELMVEKECLVCHENSTYLSPEEFQIDEIHRFEGDSDPGDEMIVYGISSTIHNIKGIVVNGYGLYSDPLTFKIVSRLKKHI
ncbi:phosphoribosylpyrophosphate synthetase [Flavobacterium psychraquaticum]|uniref:phosphoribosylpyrophosphate synthetase n=1 Tax=Flavobacterium psychraquaticum TaxID=3103958 RepID=UPI002ACD7F4D|nr:phosphoribosylpyrophosphate synthetase [Flavobacterium sp. LB-N7T]